MTGITARLADALAPVVPGAAQAVSHAFIPASPVVIATDGGGGCLDVYSDGINDLFLDSTYSHASEFYLETRGTPTPLMIAISSGPMNTPSWAQLSGLHIRNRQRQPHGWLHVDRSGDVLSVPGWGWKSVPGMETYAGVGNPVPVPASARLLCSGIAALAGIGRNPRNRQPA